MKPLKVYLAGPWAHRDVARQTAELIRMAGFEIVSKWHDWSTAGTDDTSEFAAEASIDWDDVRDADALVVLNIEKSEGKAVEQGMALAYGKRIVVIGTERFNIFQYLPKVEFVPTLEDALESLSRKPRLFARLPRLLSPTFSPVPRDSEPASTQ